MAARARDLRHRAREAALQMLYQWEIAGMPIEEAAATVLHLQWPDADPPPAELAAFASSLASDTVGRLADIDPMIAETAERWRPERMAVLDRLILRMAVCEMLRRDRDAPAPVVINEALELARRFSTEDAVKFVNGMLDAIRKKLDTKSTTAEDTEEPGGHGSSK